MALEDRLNTANPGTDFADYGIDNNFWNNAKPSVYHGGRRNTCLFN